MTDEVDILRKLIGTIANQFGIPKLLLSSKDKHEPQNTARQLYMYIGRQITFQKLEVIGMQIKRCYSNVILMNKNFPFRMTEKTSYNELTIKQHYNTIKDSYINIVFINITHDFCHYAVGLMNYGHIYITHDKKFVITKENILGNEIERILKVFSKADIIVVPNMDILFNIEKNLKKQCLTFENYSDYDGINERITINNTSFNILPDELNKIVLNSKYSDLYKLIDLFAEIQPLYYKMLWKQRNKSY